MLPALLLFATVCVLSTESSPTSLKSLDAYEGESDVVSGTEPSEVLTGLQRCSYYCCPTDTVCCGDRSRNVTGGSVGFISGSFCCKNGRQLAAWPC